MRCSDVFQALRNIGDNIEGTSSQQQNQTNTIVPAWMLSHMSSGTRPAIVQIIRLLEDAIVIYMCMYFRC